MKVEILLLCWNRLGYTKEALEHHLNKSHYPHTLVIADNGSTDGTREYLKELESNKEFQERYPCANFKFRYYEKNFGKSRVTNHFFRLASPDTQYVGMFYNDIVPGDQWVERFVRVLDNDPEIGIVGDSDRQWDTHSIDARVVDGMKIFAGDQFFWNDECYLMRYKIIKEMESLERASWSDNKFVHSGYHIGNWYGVTEQHYYASIKGLNYKLAVVDRILNNKEHTYAKKIDLARSDEYRKHDILTKRIFCMDSTRYQEVTKGILTWEENGQKYTFDGEPEYEKSCTTKHEHVLKAMLDDGTREDDINLFTAEELKAI